MAGISDQNNLLIQDEWKMFRLKGVGPYLIDFELCKSDDQNIQI